MVVKVFENSFVHFKVSYTIFLVLLKTLDDDQIFEDKLHLKGLNMLDLLLFTVHTNLVFKNGLYLTV